MSSQKSESPTELLDGASCNSFCIKLEGRVSRYLSAVRQFHAVDLATLEADARGRKSTLSHFKSLVGIWRPPARDDQAPLSGPKCAVVVVDLML